MPKTISACLKAKVKTKTKTKVKAKTKVKVKAKAKAKAKAKVKATAKAKVKVKTKAKAKACIFEAKAINIAIEGARGQNLGSKTTLLTNLCITFVYWFLPNTISDLTHAYIDVNWHAIYLPHSPCAIDFKAVSRCSSVLTTWRQSTSLITASQSLPILDVATSVRLHVVTLLSHRQEQPITVHAVLPWQARPRGTHCLRRSMISSYLSPHSGVSWKHTCSAEHTSAHHEHARDCFQLEWANINFSI